MFAKSSYYITINLCKIKSKHNDITVPHLNVLFSLLQIVKIVIVPIDNYIIFIYLFVDAAFAVHFISLTIQITYVIFNFLQTAICEHAFCRACITEWLTRQQTCPVDRNAITYANLRAVPRILKNLLTRCEL